MTRYYRHISVVLPIALLLIVGFWLAVPRDICFTKVLVSGQCGCAGISIQASNTCPCCASSKVGRTLPCDTHGSSDVAPPGETEHSSHCLLVSSAMSKVTGAERAPQLIPAFDVVAILPLVVGVPQQSGWDFTSHPERNLALYYAGSYRDNCVLLI